MAAPLEPGFPDCEDLDRVDREVRNFEQACRLRDDVALVHYWSDRAGREPLDSREELICLGGLIKADLRRRFERGETPAVASYLEEFPRLATADSRVISLIYEEYCLREERGDRPDVESFCDRYPDWRDSLASQLRYHRLLSQAVGLPPPKPRFPESGESFEEFALRTQIGKGGYSRVFLADDLSLGGKRVVLKVSIDRGREAETQGALDHPHIVPINSVTYQPDEGLRGLAMPYRPGLPLDEIIRRVRVDDGAPRSARVLWDCLVEGIDLGPAGDRDEGFAAALERGPHCDGWRGFPVDGSFARGVAWIGLVLAQALDYAHRRETFHRDVKPGNVLLTIQHGPQLLDFNLAQSPHSPVEAESALLGGTLPYMAPEQIEAFLNPDLWGRVGAQADLYSLGLVLRELLTGLSHELPNPDLPPPRAMREMLDRRAGLSTDLRSHDPRIPHGLEAIVKKCLEFDPADRYADAASLADDLENFLERRPLTSARNPSRVERLVNWATRNRRLLIANALYLCVLGALSPLLVQQAARLLQPAVRDRAEFHQAVAAVEREDYQRATTLLMKLVEEYPSAPLPRFYLGIALAHADTLPEDASQVYYASAMNMPDSDEELRSWLGEHPRLGNHLQWFGRVNLGKIKTLAARPSSPASEEATRRIFRTAAHASSHALIVDPNSTETIQQLATIAEYQKDYETAHKHLSSLLDVDREAGAGATNGELATWRLQRARVTLLRAKELIRSTDPGERPRAVELANEAVADLDFGSGIVSDNLRLVHLGLRTEALVTRAELHRLLGLRAFAESDLAAAKSSLETWTRLAGAGGSPVSLDQQDKYRERLRALGEGLTGNDAPRERPTAS